MGLAASQARLLLLTARQSDIENQLTNIADQKIALSRQTAEISSKYNDALNTTKLTWSTPDNGKVDLTYALLMRPNIEADSGQYILTNASTSRVILDDGYISDLGIAQAGNANDIANVTYTFDGKTYTGEKAFLMRLLGCNPSSADNYISKGNTTVKPSTFNTYYKDADIISSSIGLGAYSSVTTLGTDSSSTSWWSGASSSVDSSVTLQNFDTLLKSYSTSMDTVLKDKLETNLGTKYDTSIKSGLAYAYQATYNKFVSNTNDAESTDGIQLGSMSLADGNADGTNRIASQTVKEKGFLGFSSSSTTTVTVDNSQVADTYLSYFDQYCAQNFGGENKSTVGATTTARGTTGGTGSETDNTVTHSDVQAGDLNVNNNDVNDAYEASFYINLYNALLSSGWQTNSNADDKKYLQTQVLYGNIAIKQLQEDGSWNNLSSSDTSSPLGSEKDTDAIDKAKTTYEAEKSALDSKEAKLEVNSNNLDSERTAITTEVDSVQSILKKNIETSFKIFQA